MDLVNIQEAYDYSDGLTDDRERSAAIVIHISYMERCTSRAGAARMAAETPLDLLLLYRAAVAAFLDSPIGEAGGPLAAAGRVVNRDAAQRRLATISDPRLLHRAGRLVDAVITQSRDSPCEQDLFFILDLFLATFVGPTFDAVESGEAGRASRQLKDPDYW